ncbi:MAG: multicopper oxidase domain-containing protein, partial [Chloroflexota bacterium]
MSNDDMDAEMEAVVKAFPAKTAGVGGVPLEYTMDNGVRVFELVCQEIKWETTPGQMQEAHAYNGIVPGPEIRCVEGEPVRISVKNEMTHSTGVHWHGQQIVNAMDGVPFLTQPPIKPGETFVYEFTPRPYGSHMYHSHHNATEQVGGGMLGALIVDPKDKTVEPQYDLDYTFITNDQLGGFTVNGKGFPATAPVVAKLGQRVRIRFMNEGQMAHPLHLHGLIYEVFARDGYLLPQPFKCDTLNVAPGERWDVIVVADNPGTWAFHCHILNHAEGSKGMFGMVTVFVVQDANAASIIPQGSGTTAAFASQASGSTASFECPIVEA